MHNDYKVFLDETKMSLKTIKSIYLFLYEKIYTARQIDLLEAQYTNRGEAFFHVSGAGHEAVAALHSHLIPADYLHLHYRDKSLMLARGISPEMFFYSLFCKAASHSNGRQMSAHLSDHIKHILSLVGPVGNNALQAVGVAAEIKSQRTKPIVICAMGDGTSQQGEVLEAIAEAVRWQLPVLFLIEDNKYSISARTEGKTFYDLPANVGGAVDTFYGLPIQRIDGTCVRTCYGSFGDIVSTMRSTRQPALIHLLVERLANHTNADDQTQYRHLQEISELQRTADPVINFKNDLLANGFTSEQLTEIEQKIQKKVLAAAKKAQRSINPTPTFEAKIPLSPELTDHECEYRGTKSQPQLTMLEAIRAVLYHHLQSNSRVTLYGEDIEDPKGDVFGVTRGLSTAFPNRVINAPLSESTIVGTSVGRALAGGRPIAFLQFADFLPLAFNQIISELATIYWRTNGSWTCPVIIMITCGGYRPGLGPFHAQSLEALALHTPGIDIVMPATAGDAAGMLNAAFKTNRPTLFFYPKSALNLKSEADTTSGDVYNHFIPVGKARVERQGKDITLVTYGNGLPLCRKVADELERIGVQAELIDLRWLSPWDRDMVLNSAQKTTRVIIVHEDNQTCGMAAEISATLHEQCTIPIQCKRITRPDTFIPCNFSNQLEILPSFQNILEAAAELLSLDVAWEKLPDHSPDTFFIDAVGTAPSDESVQIVEWYIQVGDTIEPGQPIANIEATKAAFDLESPVSGYVEQILVDENNEVIVGTPIVKVRLAKANANTLQLINKERGGVKPMLTKRQNIAEKVPESINIPNNEHRAVGLIAVAREFGARVVENQELLQPNWEKTAEDITRMTGIRTRHYADASQDTVSLGTAAAKKVLEQTGTPLTDINLVICATGTNNLLSPAVACRIVYNIGGEWFDCPAYDINAACAGYIYALHHAYYYLQQHPKDKVLVITSEVISTLVDPADITTSMLFGDAATASIIAGECYAQSFRYHIRQPYISAIAESGKYLNVPPKEAEASLAMDGMMVFNMGVRYMSHALQKVCDDAQIAVSNLDLVVPHQANQRLIDTICMKLKIDRSKAFSRIASTGNTSASSIPICLTEILDSDTIYQKIGLTAFGAGFVYGGCVLTHKK